MIKQNKYKLLMLFLMAPFSLKAQYLINNGAYFTIASGTELVISGNLVNQNTVAQDVITNNGSIRLTGNLSNEGTFNGTGTTYFEGTSTQEIGGAGTSAFGTLDIDNPAGVSLAQDITLNTALNFKQGIIDLNGNSMVLGSAASISGTPNASKHIDASSGSVRKEYASTGSFLFPVGDGTNYSPITLNFTSGSLSSGSATVSVTNAKHPNNSSASHFLNRYWTVSSSGITGFSCNVSALYANADINGTETLLTGAKYSAGEWMELGAVTPASNLITGTVSGFSDFTAGESAAFPVEWLDFAATRQGSTVRLNWATASEVNNDYFAVERSADREYWSGLGEVEAMGNGHAVQSYRFDDLQPLAGKAWYRLRQVDLDGGVSYSQVVEVSEGVQGGLKTWPNPVQDQLHFALNSAEQVTATLTDLSGRVVWQQVLPSGSATVAVDQLPAGVYFLRVRGETGVLAEQKMMKE